MNQTKAPEKFKDVRSYFRGPNGSIALGGHAPHPQTVQLGARQKTERRVPSQIDHARKDLEPPSLRRAAKICSQEVREGVADQKLGFDQPPSQHDCEEDGGGRWRFFQVGSVRGLAQEDERANAHFLGRRHRCNPAGRGVGQARLQARLRFIQEAGVGALPGARRDGAVGRYPFQRGERGDRTHEEQFEARMSV